MPTSAVSDGETSGAGIFVPRLGVSGVMQIPADIEEAVGSAHGNGDPKLSVMLVRPVLMLVTMLKRAILLAAVEFVRFDDARRALKILDAEAGLIIDERRGCAPGNMVAMPTPVVDSVL